MILIVIVLIGIVLVSVTHSLLIIRHIKKQISEMSEALAEVKNGNGCRRILADKHDLLAPIAYEINNIVKNYETRIALLHQTEETNKQLMTSLSHDVRTPLTTLIGYLDAVYKKINSGEEREKYIKTALLKAHDLKEYIDILFDWFKLNSNEFAMQIDTFEITEKTRNILIDWIPMFENKQIEYEIDIPEGPLRVKLDLDGYARILNNLIQNVISHSHADRIKFTIFQQDSNVKIIVTDNGIGIEKEDLKHIFERLYKCDKGRSEKGSGLGLSIAHQLAAKMGGRLTAESTLGKGTVFTVLIPLAG